MLRWTILQLTLLMASLVSPLQSPLAFLSSVRRRDSIRPRLSRTHRGRGGVPARTGLTVILTVAAVLGLHSLEGPDGADAAANPLVENTHSYSIVAATGQVVAVGPINATLTGLGKGPFNRTGASSSWRR